MNEEEQERRQRIFDNAISTPENRQATYHVIRRFFKPHIATVLIDAIENIDDFDMKSFLEEIDDSILDAYSEGSETKKDRDNALKKNNDAKEIYKVK